MLHLPFAHHGNIADKSFEGNLIIAIQCVLHFLGHVITD
jgi:hypothetical protein